MWLISLGITTLIATLPVQQIRNDAMYSQLPPQAALPHAQMRLQPLRDRIYQS